MQIDHILIWQICDLPYTLAFKDCFPRLSLVGAVASRQELAFGNSHAQHAWLPYGWRYSYRAETGGGIEWYVRLLQDSGFVQRVRQRGVSWPHLCATVPADQHMQKNRNLKKN